MGELLGAIILALVSGITLAALLTTLTYLLPEQVQRTQAVLEGSAKRAFVIGLVNFIFFGLLAAFGLERGPLLRLLGALLALALLAAGSVGLTAVTQILRQRIYGRQTISDTVKTAVLLITAGFTPIVGWFILAPLTLLTSLGAAIIALLRSAPPPPDEREPLPY